MSDPCDAAEGKHRILVAEDDPATLVLLERQLERAGYEVVACPNGRQALTALTEGGADIVIADWSMPEMTGVELCRAVSELRASQAIQTLYFILLTAHHDKQRVVEGLEAGADDFLRKPYDFQELLARIRAGERLLRLQEELTRRQIELSRSNAELVVLNHKLLKLANFDALTELPNRRYVLERFHDGWALAQRHGRPLSCILMDIDRFKKVNDMYGHKAGDAALHGIACTLRLLVRRYDTCGRFGGEEFLVVCPDGAVQAAATLAERIRAGVAGQPISVDQARIGVTVSLGAAAMREEHTSPEALLAEADAMLYRAKEHGRNQVWYADSQGRAQRFDPLAARDSAAPTPVE